MYEKLEELYKPIQEFMSQNPNFGYLFAAVGFGFILLGVIFNWDWVVMPDSGRRRWFHRFMMENFGRKATRIWLGFLTGLTMIICLFGYYLSL
jgi:hypothetical protein